MAVFSGKFAGLLAVPNGPEFEGTRKAIKESFDKCDVDPLILPMSFTTDFLSMCKRASLIVADVSKNEPCIYYALGALQAFQKPSLLLSQNNQVTPFDISGYRVLMYEPDHLRRLSELLVPWLRDINVEQTPAEE
jgi:hypothetical protein